MLRGGFAIKTPDTWLQGDACKIRGGDQCAQVHRDFPKNVSCCKVGTRQYRFSHREVYNF